MKTLKIPKITKTEFDRRLNLRTLENTDSIKMVEAFFLKKRGYVFKMPKPGTAVVLMLSGGLESTIIWGLLLKKYKLNVYPLFLYRGSKRKDQEKKSVSYFSKYFASKYPEIYHDPKQYSVNVPPPELEKEFKNPDIFFHPSRKLEHLDTSSNLSQIDYNYGILPFTLVFYGVAYANYLYDHHNIKCRTIFCGVASGDGNFVASQTFSALRASLYSACIATNTYDWQIAAPAFEKEIGHWLEKSDLIKLGHSIGLPLEHTWSCYRSGNLQCGDNCLTCKFRRMSFEKARVKDKTHYENQDLIYLSFRKIKMTLRKTLDKVFSMF